MQITTDVSTSSVTRRVQRGAAWLDTKRPGWWDEINVARLDIGSGEDCVIAQLHDGSFGRGLDRMDPNWDIDLRANGFMGGTIADERELSREWAALILRRRGGERYMPGRVRRVMNVFARLGYRVRRLFSLAA